MRRLHTALFMASVMVISAFSLNLGFGQTVSIVPTPSSVVRGESFSVAVNVAGVADLQATHVEVSFDNSLVQLTGVTRATTFYPAGDGSSFNYAPSPGPSVTSVKVDQAILGGNPLAGAGTLFTLNFTGVNAGDAPIGISVTLRNHLNQPITPSSVNGATVTVNNPLPTTTLISPTGKNAGEASFPLSIEGTNFVPTSIARVGGADRTPTVIDASHMTVTVLASDILTGGLKSITVFNPTPGGGESNAQTLTVNHIITATAGANGSISPVGATPVAPGANQSFAITPNAGYHIATLLVDGGAVTISGTYDFTNVTANHTIAATFALDVFTIAASAGPNGSIAPSGNVSVNSGANQSFAITPNPGYHIATLLVDGNPVTIAGTYDFTNVTVNHTIAATFAIDVYTITASAGLNGSITPSGAVGVNSGASQSFAITPNAGYHIATLLVDGSPATIAGTYDFTNVTANHTIAATFAINVYTIAASAGPNGSITPSGDVSVNSGANQSFAITPNAGYHIATLLVDGGPVTIAGTYDFTNVTANHTIAATFEITAFTITATAGANGSIAPSGAVGVNSGANQSFAITPNAGYHIATLLVDGNPVAIAGTYDFTNVTANHTIAVTFGQNAPTKLVFAQQPTTTIAGVIMNPAVTVRIEDAEGNLVTSDTRNVVMGILNNPGSGLLGGTVSVSAVGGIATFSTLTINKTGTGYTLQATTTSDPALTSATSSAFNITPGGLDHFVFNSIPDQVAGTPFSITVTALDANGNTATGYSLSGAFSTTAGTITPPTSNNFAAGVLTQNVTVTAPGTGRTISLDDGQGHLNASNQFNVADAPQVYLKSGALLSSSSILFPNAAWNVTSPGPDDWSFTDAPVLSFYVVPAPGIVFSSCDITLTWDGTELSYTGATAGNAGGPDFLATPGTNQVTIHRAATTGDNPAIVAGDYLAKINFTILKPGHASVQMTNVHFVRTANGEFAVTPHDGEIKAYLGDVASPSQIVSQGDGKIDFEDLAPWSSSYWSVAPDVNYKVKYDIGPTMTGYLFGMPAHLVNTTLTPGPDGKIEFEDLAIFSISFGQSESGGLPKISAPPKDPLQVSLGQPTVVGNETRIGVMLGGNVSDVRALRLEMKGQFGKFLGAEKGSLLQSYETPVMVMSRSSNGKVFVDLAIMGLNAQGMDKAGEVVVLRFEGAPQIQLTRNDARNSNNGSLPAQKVRGAGEAVPTAYALLQNYPNPFNPSTTIAFDIPVTSQVTLDIYNVLGEKLATLVNDVREAGTHRVVWDGKDEVGRSVATGVYFYRVRAGDFNSVMKMLMVK